MEAEFKKVAPGKQCAICIDEFQHGVMIVEIRCSHKFHPECISGWLRLHHNCPMCRGQIDVTIDMDMYQAGMSTQNDQDI